MKKILILGMLLIAAISAQAQNINADRVIVKDSIYLNGKWVKSFSADTSLGDGADNVIPTQGAVKGALKNIPTLFTSDGKLTDNRTIDANGFELHFTNGFYVGDSRFYGDLDDNLMLGSLGFTGAITGNQNTGIGAYVFTQNPTGSYNTAVGRSALQSLTSGIENTAVGLNALKANQSGINNTAVGDDALHSNTTGSWNSAVGHQALYGNINGTRNVGVGNGALADNESGSYNTAIGYGAMRAKESGDSSIAIGVFSALVGYGEYSHMLSIGNKANLNDPDSKLTIIGNLATRKLRFPGYSDADTTLLGTDEVGNLFNAKEYIADMMSDSLKSVDAGVNIANTTLTQENEDRGYFFPIGTSFGLYGSGGYPNILLENGTTTKQITIVAAVNSFLRLNSENLTVNTEIALPDYDNNSSEDSVLTTDVSGNIKLINLADKIASQISDSIQADSLANIQATAISAYTLELRDLNTYIQSNGSADMTVIIPASSTTDFAVGSQIYFIQSGSGYISFSPASGVTLHSATGNFETRTQYSVCQLIKTGTDTWLLFGDVK